MGCGSTLRFHGGVRGSEALAASRQLEGRFGRMFRTLPAARFDVAALSALGAAMVAPLDDPPTPETELDAEENSGISAGYTYLGQFIDHDLTFDPASSLIKTNDPDALTDFRTPRFDLDNLYGRGPDDQPYLYDPDGIHLQLGRALTGNPADPVTRDLARHTALRADGSPVPGAPARALIGDPRNDENVIVSQLQATMIRFHNHMVDQNPGASLEEVQRIVRWHYQYVVLNDFLPTIVGEDTMAAVLPHRRSGRSIYEDRPHLQFYKWTNMPFMPIEFSAAAYRFGHSMVRPLYRLNTTLGATLPDTDPRRGRIDIFDPAGDDFSLTGFRSFPSVWAVDWSLYFDFGNGAPPLGMKRVQPAYKIDTSLVNPLGRLPDAVASNPNSLAARNLVRGMRMNLPSGQDVARAMHLPVLPDDKLFIGKATDDPRVAPSITALPGFGTQFKGRAPLWFYVLAEAQLQSLDGSGKPDNSLPIRLGPVGGRLVAEVMIGLLLGDSHSFLSQDPGWTPVKTDFRMADLLKMALLP